jgi:hypothetical protein
VFLCLEDGRDIILVPVDYRVGILRNNALFATVSSWLMITALGVVLIVIPNRMPLYALMHMIGVICFGKQFITAANMLPVLQNTGVMGRLGVRSSTMS